MPARFVSGNDVRLYHVRIAAVPTKSAVGDDEHGTNNNCANPVNELGRRCRDGHSAHRSMSAVDRNAARQDDTEKAGSDPDVDSHRHNSHRRNSDDDAEKQTDGVASWSSGSHSLGDSRRQGDGNKPVRTDIPVREERNPNNRPQISIRKVSIHNVPGSKLGVLRMGTSTRDASCTHAIYRPKFPESRSGSATGLGLTDPLPVSVAAA